MSQGTLLPQISTPFTEDQVASLCAYQGDPTMHEFTCRNDGCPSAEADFQPVLRPARGGWTCPECDYRQDWAFAFMADWSWQ